MTSPDIVQMENESAKDINKSFPWHSKFLRLTIQSIESKDESLLENLIMTFLRLVSVEMQQCYTRPKRAAKLIPVVTQVMIYFNMFYNDIKSEMASVSVYLGLMSDLIALYVDLEIKASKLGVESVKKVAHKITSAVYIFLDYSEAHVAEAILKAKLISKANVELCTLVLSKFLNDADCFITQESDYVRFLLVFKLWKKIRKDPKERKLISEMAVCKLNPPPEVIDHVKKRREVSGVDENITFLLMNSKTDLIKTKREFLRSSGLSKYRKTPGEEFPAMDFFSVNPSKNGSQEETSRLSTADDEISRVGKKVSRETTWSLVPVEGNKPESGVAEPVSTPMSSDPVLVGKTCRGTQSVERCSQNQEGVEPKRLRFETVARRFKIVKSNKLRKEVQSLPEKQVKEFTFSSKLVKITAEELTEIKPSKTRNWKGRRSRQINHSERLKNTVQRGQDFGRTTWSILDQNDESLDMTSPLGFSDLNNKIENDFRDLLHFINAEDDFIRCMCPDTLLDPQKLTLRGCAECCDNFFDFPGNDLFSGYGDDEGTHHSVNQCKYLLGKGTVSDLVRVLKLQTPYHFRSHFCRILRGRCQAYRQKRKQEELPQSTDDSFEEDVFHVVENSANLPLKKRLKLRLPRISNDFETNKESRSIPNSKEKN